MNVLTAQEPSRVGCVTYLNSKPLVLGREDRVSFETPASLTEGMSTGRLKVALAPIFALVSHPDYRVVDGVGIVSRGPVYSVVIVHRGDIADLRRLYLDTASRSSANLQRVLLAEFHGLTPTNEPLPPPGEPQPLLAEGEGALLIGDRAIDFRLKHGEDSGFRYFDLGAAWQKATGLPFVFAAWHVHPAIDGLESIASRLRCWRRTDPASIEQVVAEECRYPAEFSRFYLTQCIHFDIDADARRAVDLYARLLFKHGVIPAPPPPGGFHWI